MCGIIGCIGKNKPVSFLIEGLKSLEYRGYDSAGIALKNDDQLQVIRSVGKISFLEDKIKNIDLIDSRIGIAHTRWATHGAVVDINAHPHTVGKVTLVHNGIIENAAELREKLENEGVIFKSSTDTEVIAALINKYLEDDVVLAIEKVIKELKGSYALAILVEGINKIFALRKDSPLIIGISDDEYFVASDIAAIISYTNKYFLLEENEIASMDFNQIEVTKNGKKIKKEILLTDIKVEDKDKCGYEHYMLKEIMEEPVVLEKTLKPLIENLDSLPNLEEYEEIHIVACGSAMYAGMIGKSLFEEYSDIKVVCEIASEYRYKKVFYSPKTLVTVISQSGETADTIAAMRKAKENGVDTLAIVNVKSSTIARESDKQIFIEAGPEIAVATTKAYILQVAILALLSYKTALIKGLVEKNILEEFKIIPKMVKTILDKRNDYLEVARKICDREHIFFIGRKIDYALCLEGSLKLKEVSYIHSEAYQAGELKHGTISLIDDESVVISIITDDTIREKSISNVEEVRSRGAKIISISNERNSVADLEIILEKTSDFTQSLLIVPCLQLIAYEVAKMRGCDIDKPKNLAKSVTVE